MHLNRFTQMFSDPAPQQASQGSAVPAGFALCPIFIVSVQNQTANVWQDLYRAAYEEAQAKARISRLEKRLFSVWN